MEEIKVYLDSNKENEVKGTIEFEKVVAGQITTKKIYILNNINYELNIELILEGDYIKISKTIEKISPNKVQEVEFEFNPKVTLMKPITAQLQIKLNYVVR